MIKSMKIKKVCKGYKAGKILLDGKNNETLEVPKDYVMGSITNRKKKKY